MAKVRDPGEEEVRVKVYRKEGKRTGGSQVSQQLVYCLHQQTERLTQHCNTQASLSLPSHTVQTNLLFFSFIQIFIFAKMFAKIVQTFSFLHFSFQIFAKMRK
jgi:hypothetical protein